MAQKRNHGLFINHHAYYRLSFYITIVFILMVQPYRAYGSSRGSIGLASVNTIPNPLVDGICASSVIVHGFKCQEFQVETEDGYILSMQRIPEGVPGSKGAGNGERKQPVLIQHGVLVDGSTWFLNPAEQNLPLILANEGFDVWIANTRGTRFSLRHRTLDPRQPEFWNWSWDELVTYDLPAAFDFVYNHTGQKIDYVGHSLGTLIAIASFSEGRQVDKLKSAALLSPIAYLSHMTTAIGVLAARSLLGEIIKLLGFAEFNPKSEPVGQFVRALCRYPGVNCYDLMSAITDTYKYKHCGAFGSDGYGVGADERTVVRGVGENCCLNSSTIDLFLEHQPQPTSTKNLMHLAQTVRYGILAKYDYGNPFHNLAYYGMPSPPIYNISNIPHDLPLFISYGGKDALSDVRDVDLLLDGLKFHDGDKLTVQYIDNYAHADFIMGVNAKDVVYNAILSFFKRQ